MVSSSQGTRCARRCSSVLTSAVLSRRMKSMRLWAAPPTTSSSATPHVRSIAAFNAISTACWQCHTAREGMERRPSSDSCISRLTTTISSFASCRYRAASTLSTMRRWDASSSGIFGPAKSGASAVAPAPSGPVALPFSGAADSACAASFSSLGTHVPSSFACRISFSNSSNQEAWPPSSPSPPCSPPSPASPSVNARRSPSRASVLPAGSFVFLSASSSSLSSQESSPTSSPAIFFLYHCSWARSRWKMRVAKGVLPALSGCQVLKSRRITAL
mmetsp:Transcript_37489/g.107116  ORF Transcript_37489/g.107116 Transcript_37489/m.107116 type:complete len:274 (-) Transcript_37489:599-1420(-)